MKQFISTLTVFFVLGICGNVSAQTFTIPHDTIKAIVSADDKHYNKITNVSLSPIVVGWKITSYDFPADWRSTLSICDNKTCYSGNDLFDGTVRNTKSIAGGTTAEFYVWPDVSAAVTGTYYIKINMNDGSYSKDSWYIFTKEASSSIGTVSVSDNDFVLYPNPASDEVTILHNQSLNISSAVIFAANGQLISNISTGGEATHIPVRELPSGLYFVSIMDKNGSVIRTTKFNRL